MHTVVMHGLMVVLQCTLKQYSMCKYVCIYSKPFNNNSKLL